MKTFAPKFILSILATSVIVAGIVYAASPITTLTSQNISAGDTMGEGWFQAVNDKVNNISQWGTCSLTENQLGSPGCPPGSVVYRVNTICGEGACSGGGGNSCKFFDGTHVGQTDATSCY